MLFVVQFTVVVTELLFDGLMFAMTLRKTYQHAHQMRLMGESSITHLLLRDGQFISQFLPHSLITLLYRHIVFLVGILIHLPERMRLRWPRAVSFSFLIAIAVTGTQLYSMTHDNAVSE